MMTTTQEATRLYHVGCGRHLFDLGQADGMALACRCGANSPIVVPDLESVEPDTPALPGSLLRVRIRPNARDLPHIEYYLGFSEFKCPAKSAWEVYLRLLGLKSFAECTEKKCRDYYEEEKARPQ